MARINEQMTAARAEKLNLFMLAATRGQDESCGVQPDWQGRLSGRGLRGRRLAAGERLAGWGGEGTGVIVFHRWRDRAVGLRAYSVLNRPLDSAHVLSAVDPGRCGPSGDRPCAPAGSPTPTSPPFAGATRRPRRPTARPAASSG